MFIQNLFHCLKMTTILIMSMFCCLYTSFAQIATITGTVVSSENNQPLASATVTLRKASDSTTVTGAIAKSGRFSIDAKQEGKFYLEVKFVGYETKNIDVNINSSTSKNINLGEIKLKPTTVKQKEVTVEAEREAVVIGIDSKTFNVDKDLTAGGSTVIDLLRKIPSVNVDMDDNITMNGSSPKILIDGKESNLASKDMLKILSSDLVESVELITNPSAKYEAEGVSGIIDIKFKKNRDDGFNAMLNLWSGIVFQGKKNNNHTGLGIHANQKLGKLNLFGNINYGNWANYSDWISKRTIWLNDDTTFNLRDGFFDGSGHWGGIGIGADYDITDKDVITFRINTNGSLGETEVNDDYDFNNNVNQTIRKTNRNRKQPEFSNLGSDIGLNYKKNFEEKGHNLYVDFYFTNNKSNNKTNAANIDYFSLTTDTVIDLFKQNVDAKSQRIAFQVDYEKTLKYLGNLGAGYKSIFRDVSNDNAMLNFNNEANDYITDTLLSDAYKYNDVIHSAYFMIGNKIDNFSYRVGFRAEYTDWKFDSKSTNSIFTDNYFSWIPTVHLRYSLGLTHTFSVSYARRLERPWHSRLNPFVNLYDSTTIYAGNPELKQCYYNSYQVDYMLFTPKTTVTTSAFYKNTDNAVSEYILATEWGGMFVKPFNLAKHVIIGASISFMQTITDWWSLNAFVNLFNTKFDAPSAGISNRQETSWSSNINTTFKLLDNLRFQIYGNYSPITISVQGRNPAYYSINAGLNYEFWDKKMSVGLICNNLIYNTNNEETVFGENLLVYSRYNWIHRSFFLSISYKINDYKAKQERGIDDGGSGSGQGNETR